MRLAVAFGLLSCVCFAQPVTYTVAGNLVQFRARDGAAEFEWLSSASFRFRRDWRPNSSPKLPRTASKIEFQTEERGTEVVLTSRYLSVIIDRATFGIGVTAEGKPIDLGVFAKEPGKLVCRRSLVAGEQLFGLGTTESKGLDNRGLRISGDPDLLLSSEGYGLVYRTPGNYVYDLGASNPKVMRVVLNGADSIEEFFYYGPTPKEILESRRQQLSLDELPSEYLRILSERELPGDVTQLPAGSACELMHSLAQLSMSGRLYPATDIARTPASIAPLLPLLYSASGQAAESLKHQRERWTPYLIAYLREAFDRGFPIVRPLVMQFPRDVALHDVYDELMIGDELLIAAPCNAAGDRAVRLPMGIWTDLRDNRQYQGKREVRLRADVDNWPVLVRNGSILPLQEHGRLELHYFPSLGAEFFLYEPAVEEHSQYHAGPAGDYWRLETESKVARRYEWVMHHVDRPRYVARDEVMFEAVDSREALRPGTWYHDPANRNLHVLIDVPARIDHILNIRF